MRYATLPNKSYAGTYRLVIKSSSPWPRGFEKLRLHFAISVQSREAHALEVNPMIKETIIQTKRLQSCINMRFTNKLLLTEHLIIARNFKHHKDILCSVKRSNEQIKRKKKTTNNIN